MTRLDAARVAHSGSLARLVTVIIPTRNRATYLRVLLNYLNHPGLPFRIVVLDAGDPELSQKIKENIGDWSGQLDVRYEKAITVDSPRSSIRFYQQLAALLPSIESPYVGVLADDDHYIARGLTEIASALRDGPEVAVCSGVAGQVRETAGGQKGSTFEFHPFAQPAIQSGDPVDRVLRLLANPTNTIFTVQNTRHLKTSLDLMTDWTLPDGLLETLQSCLLVMQGPIRHLDVFYLVMHRQADAVSMKSDLKSDALDVLDPTFALNIARLRQAIEVALERQGIDVPTDFGERFRHAMNQQLASKWFVRFKRDKREEASLAKDYAAFRKILDGSDAKSHDDLQTVLKSINTRNAQRQTDG